MITLTVNFPLLVIHLAKFSQILLEEKKHTDQLELLVVVGGGVVSIDEGASIVEDCANEHTQGEHVAEGGAGGRGLHFGGREVQVRLTHLRQFRGERLTRHWTLRQGMWRKRASSNHASFLDIYSLVQLSVF
ncbi:hypothetical protein TNIN_499731 [Trichonephila inaurata madagascariensis]|uniref:Uncharacterized protein n=1 Tax=Trichonephila inaurata madagascariensis TaxID=2747483 RepID=A0A8X6JLC4_9ARAC|nr:hypothetical protein TNIN_499731 [Trichonephila inaurata madagascariensis]